MPQLKPSKRRGHQAEISDLRREIEGLKAELIKTSKVALDLELKLQKYEGGRIG